MDDIKDLLEKNLEAAEQTLKLVKKLHRAHVWSQVFSFVKWALIISLTVFSFLQLQPYLSSLLKSYQTIMSAGGQINKLLPK